MKTTPLRIVAMSCAITLFSQTVASTWASAQEPLSASITQSNRSSLIQQHLIGFLAMRDAGVPVQSAFESFKQSLIDAGITSADIQSFVRTHASPKSARSFEQALESLRPVFIEQSSSEEISATLNALKFADFSVNASGLTWSGCAGEVVGIILLVGAAITGIVALASITGTEAIKNDYNNKRSSRISQYNSAKNSITSKKTALEDQLAELNAQKTQQQSRYDYYRQKLQESTNPADKAKYSAQLADAQQQLSGLNAKIASAQLDLNYWSDPVNVDYQMSIITNSYQGDMDAYNSEELSKIAEAESDNRLAGTLSMAAGGALAAGLYLTLDGTSDGGCK